jgi:Protein of unknown function (DUF4239)
MSDWIYNLPVVWMALVVFVATYLVAGCLCGAVLVLAKGERARAFKAVSPGMLPPLGIIFGLFVAFLAAQVWGDLDRAQAAVNREASALRTVVLLVASFPGEPEAHMRRLIRRHIQEAATQEWPAMSRHRATLTMIPAPLAETLQSTLALTPRDPGQVAAQQQILVALEDVLDARRQRIIVSESTVNWVKWTSVLLQAACALLAIALVHSDNRVTALIASAIFATGVAASVVLVAAHSGPFSGQISVGPDLLLQVMPQERAQATGR